MSQIDIKAGAAYLLSVLKANPSFHDVDIVKFAHTEGREEQVLDTVKFTYCERPYYVQMGANGLQVALPSESGNGGPVGKLILLDLGKLVSDMIDSTIKE